MAGSWGRGIIRGRTIELDEETGLAEGQAVAVRIEVAPAAAPWGAGILRSAGALADEPLWDEIDAELARARKVDRRPPAAG